MTVSAENPPAEIAVSDPAARRGGLTAWGVVLIVVGVLLALSTIASLAGFAATLERSLAENARGTRRPPMTPSWIALARSAVTLGVSATIVAAGIGACLVRRWCRPIVMVLCGFVVAYGLLQLVGLTLDLPHRMDLMDAANQNRRDTNGADQMSVILLFALRGGVMAALAIVLPYFIFRFFTSRATAAALDAADPRVVWTDRLPIPMLGWTAFLVIEIVGALLSLQKPAIPLFVTAITGQPAMIVTSVCVVILAWTAWLGWRQDRVGQLVGLVLVAILQLGGLFFFLGGGTREDLMSDWLGRPTTPPPTPSPQARQRNAAVETPAWQVTTMISLQTVLILGFGVYACLVLPTRPAGRTDERPE